jgi:hypothetical protein
MGFFKKPRVKQEEAASAGKQLEPPNRLTPRQFKAQKKSDRKENLNQYNSKKKERSSRVDALLELRSAHCQKNTIKSTSTYNPNVLPTQSMAQAADVGLTAFVIAAKQFFSIDAWK